MTPLSRREFLRMLAAGTGALTLEQLLAACGMKPTDILPPTSTLAGPAAAPTDTLPAESPAVTEAEAGPASPRAATDTTPAPPAQSASGAPDLVVARGGDPEALVRRSLAALGGMEQFVPKNARVISLSPTSAWLTTPTSTPPRPIRGWWAPW
jgi:hypothetical protein